MELSYQQKWLSRLSDIERKAHHIYYGQRARSGTCYTREQFIHWYKIELAKTNIKDPHVGRIDHSKPYSFDNIFLQSPKTNSQERNHRRGNPCKTHRPVGAFCMRTWSLIKCFDTKESAAEYFNINPKTVYNRCNRKTNKTKNGPLSSIREVLLIWI